MTFNPRDVVVWNNGEDPPEEGVVLSVGAFGDVTVYVHEDYDSCGPHRLYVSDTHLTKIGEGGYYPTDY
ncbi:hypothetical protein [Saccharothrix sp. HUAS TT1]|uniref:hypothetical protein n=1 Tax=unclassified Saccharothrix TaxID=2593673 RepID=UPI00345C5666